MKLRRRLPIWLAFAVAFAATDAAKAYDCRADSAAVACAKNAVKAVHGVWQMQDGAVMAVSDENGIATVRLLDGPDLRIARGTVIGTIKNNSGDGLRGIMTLFTDRGSDGMPSRPVEMDMSIVVPAKSKTPVMTLTPKRRYKFDVWLLYRRLVSASVRPVDGSRTVTAHRVMPGTGNSAANPAVL